MKKLYRTAAIAAIGFTVACGFGCPSVTEDGGIDNAVPAPCSADDECPEGIACLFPNGADQSGFCDVTEMVAP